MFLLPQYYTQIGPQSSHFLLTSYKQIRAQDAKIRKKETGPAALNSHRSGWFAL
jgi:hypothetical protein